MAKFVYVKAKHQPDAFLNRTLNPLGWGISACPYLFKDQHSAFSKYEDYRSTTKMAGKPTILMEIKEIEL